MTQEIEILVDWSPVRIPSGTKLDVLLEVLWLGAGLVSELVAVDGVHIPKRAWETFILIPGVRVDTVSC